MDNVNTGTMGFYNIILRNVISTTVLLTTVLIGTMQEAWILQMVLLSLNRVCNDKHKN